MRASLLVLPLLFSLAACSNGEHVEHGAASIDAGSAHDAEAQMTDADSLHAPFDATPDGTCGSVSVPTRQTLQPGSANLLIMFDQSDSMAHEFDGAPAWRSASNAVREALAPYAQQLTLGAIFFPTTSSRDTRACGPDTVASIEQAPQIPFQAGSDFLVAWEQRWTSAKLVLGTPTPVALQVGASAIDAAGLKDAPTLVLLVTDGASTCQHTSPSSAEIASAWQQRGINTYVVGLPGSKAAQSQLNVIASAGGTSTYFTPADAASLQAQLATIVGQVVKPTVDSCEISFDRLPYDLSTVDLVVTDAVTGKQYRVPAGVDGWQGASDERSAVLLGTTCQDAKAGRFSKLEFEFGCEAIPLL